MQAPAGAKAKGAYYQDALDLGHHLGAIASSDHGVRTGLTAVLSESLDREAVFRAIQEDGKIACSSPVWVK